MANTDKDILITPNRGSSNEPKIEFKGASSTVGPSTITATIYPTNNGTLSFDGTEGSLFSIANNLTTGSIFSVNPISGIPIIDVNADRTIALNPYGGNTGIGLTNPSYKLDVNGTARFSGSVYLNGETVVGGFNGTDTDQWPKFYWYRDTPNGWDEGLIRGSSSRGVFGLPHFGIHFDQSKSFAFHTSGWDTEMEIRGDGRTYIKGPLGINNTNPNAKLDVSGDFKISADVNESVLGFGMQSVSGTSVIWYGNNANSLIFKTASTGGNGDRVIITNAGAISAISTITGTQLISNIANGTAPFVVSSTTKVTNLNADYLDDQTGSYYRQAWQDIDAGVRTNYTLGFQPLANNYAGLYFSKSTSVATASDAGFLLVRGTSDTDVYTAEGITLVADAGWLTLAQRTTASKGVRIMSGTTSSAERLKVTTDGAIEFVNGTGFTYNAHTIWHAGNDGSGSGLDADLIDGVPFNNSNNTNQVSAPDSLNSNGIGYVTNISLYGQTDGALYSQAYNSVWQHQIYGDYRTGQIAIRGKNSNTWQSWRTVWDSGNAGSPSDYKRSNDQNQVNINSPASSSGSWTTGSSDEWGNPKFDGVYNEYRYADAPAWVQYNIPAGMKSAWISQLTWDTGGYVDVHGIQSGGQLVFLRRINTRQTVENTDEGVNHDGSTITFAASGLDDYSAIRFTVQSGRFHFTGLSFSTADNEGTEGVGMVHPAQISHQGSGSGLDADTVDGLNPTSANTASTIVARDASGNFSAGTLGLTGINIDGANLNATNDATVYITATNNNDWGLIINKFNSSATEYGQEIRVGSGADYAFSILGSGTRNFRINGAGSVFSNGTVTATNFIDADNTTYQFDGTGTTRLNTLRVFSNSGADWDAIQISTDGANGYIQGLGDETGLRIRSQYGNILLADDRGSVGIKNTSPLQALDVRGNFLLAADSTTATHITQKPYTINGGTLSWEGSAGQLFSITNNLTSGSIFSVNDVSGLPSIDVDANGTILFAPYGGNIGLGTLTPTQKLHVVGSSIISGTLGLGVDSAVAKLHTRVSTPTSIGSLPSGVTGILDSSSNNYLLFRNSADNGTYSGIAMQDNNVGGYVIFGNAGGGGDLLYVAGYGGGQLQYGTADSINPSARTTVASWNSTGLQINNGDLRAPLFYDSNDTAYYVDPASTSNSALRIRGGALHGPNVTWGSYLLVGGDGRNGYIDNTTTASVCSTNGNLHIDAASGYETYINLYDGNKIIFGNGANGSWGEWSSGILYSYSNTRSPIFYDYDDTAYYVDPASTSVLNLVSVRGNVIAWNTSTPGTGVGGIHLGLTSSTSNVGPAITFGARDSNAGTSAQAGIYLNTDGTYGTKMYFATTDSYAVGPKVGMSIDHGGRVTLNRSGMTIEGSNNTATGGGQIYLNGATGNRIDFNTNGVAAPAFTTRSVGTKLVLYPAIGASQVDYALGIENSTMWFSIPSSSEQFKWYAGTTNVATLTGGGSFTATGDLRAPIYRDSEDINYYVDPTSTSNIRYLKINTTGTSSGTRALTIKADGQGEINFGAYPANWTSALQIQNNDNTDMVWISPIDDGYNARFRTGGCGLDFYTDGTTTDTGTFSAFIGSGSVRSPIFYDSDDITYYLDPNSTGLSSRLAGNFEVYARSAAWAEGIRIRVPSRSTWGGIRFTRDEGNYNGNWAIGYTGIDATDDLTFWGNVSGAEAMRARLDHSANFIAYGSVRSPIFYDTDNTDYYLNPATDSLLRAVNIRDGGLKLERAYANNSIWFAGGTDDNHVLWNDYYGGPGARGGAGSGFDGMKWNTYRGIYFRTGSNGQYNSLEISGSGANTNDHQVYLYGANDEKLRTVTTDGIQIQRDLYISGSTGGNYGNRLIVGNTGTSYTLQDGNLRPTIQAYGAYPVVSLNHTDTSNPSHGPTLQFTCNGTGNQFVIGTNGTGTFLSMGYSNAGDWNPHNGINGYNGTSFFHANSSGNIGLGAGGDWGSNGGGDPGYNLHFIGSNNAVNGHAAFFDNRINAANNGSGFLFRNQYGNHSWGIVAEYRVEGTSGTDRPSILFSTGYNSNTWSVGYGYYDDNFRIKYDHGHRNGDWGTTAVLVDRSSIMTVSGEIRAPIFRDSNDPSNYYVDPNGTSRISNIYIVGGVAGVSNSSSYTEAAIEVRERGFDGVQDDTWATAPRIGFHWSGRVASQIALASNGRISILNNPGSGLEDFQCNSLYSDSRIQFIGSIVTDDLRGLYFNDDNFDKNYAIYRSAGAWSSPYPDLRIDFHTGITIGASYSYGGTRFYNDAVNNGGSVIFSVGDGDNHVRVVNNLFVSTSNTTGGGIVLADDGDIVDLNDGYCAMRFSNGVRIHSGNRTGSAVITLGSNGNVTASAFYGDGSNLTGITGGATLSASSGSQRVVLTSLTSGSMTSAATSSALTFDSSTGTLSSTIFTSTSDITKKTNIQNITNAVELTKQINGVKFDWKETSESSAGVIAQEVEEVLPEIVHTNDEGIKSVNYNGVVGLLVEAIKEQQKQIDELKKELKKLHK